MLCSPQSAPPRAGRFLSSRSSGKGPVLTVECCRPGSRPVRSIVSGTSSAAESPWKSGSGSGGLRVWNRSVRGGPSCRPPMRFRCRSRVTSRLVTGIVADLSTELRAVSRVAAASGVSWTTAMRVMEDTAVLDGGVDRRLARRLGVDEHRFRRVRYLKNDAGKVTRVEPWSIVFTDLDTGAILDIVDGRRGQAVRDWIGARPRWWRNKVEVVAMDMSAEFRRAVRKVLPKAAITVDHWHVVARANHMVTEVRRRRAHDLHGRRGRATDPAWKYRKLLTCNQENMSSAQRGRVQEIIDSDLELGVVWGIKEHVRKVLKTDHIDGFHRAWAELENAVKATRMREAKSLFLTLKMWRKELLTFCRTRSRTHAAKQRISAPRTSNEPPVDTGIMSITGSGYCRTRQPNKHAEHLPPR